MNWASTAGMCWPRAKWERIPTITMNTIGFFNTCTGRHHNFGVTPKCQGVLQNRHTHKQHLQEYDSEDAEGAV